jgi:hypothetical protein
MIMRMRFIGPVVAVLTAATIPAHAIKKVPYPEVKVKVFESYTPDAAFQKMQTAFRRAVANKDANALFALIGPTFVWTVQGELADDLDLGRDSLHNFKVVFGFRNMGQDSDGPVEGGPFWDALAGFAEDGTYYSATESGNLVCTPIGADIQDETAFDQASTKLETNDEAVDWYFTIAETPVTSKRGDAGSVVTKVNKVALPVLETYPPQGQSGDIQPTHMQVLLPSGKTGWVAASAIRPLISERLCYAKTKDGDWKIVSYDQLETEEETQQ